VESARPQNGDLTGYLPQISQYFNRGYIRENSPHRFILDVPTGCQHAVTDVRSVGISGKVEGPPEAVRTYEQVFAHSEKEHHM
jgi:hypothetical protein